ncbi:coat protein [Chaenostoma potexvirus]|uniref:Coat protein n=2 Tax=Riboviria TaxID=2559587 RepID=A0AAE9SII4_9VIRU|nr:coat protein [Chaenostoma potexvirus]
MSLSKAPTAEALKAMKFETTSTLVPTAAELDSISKELTDLKVGADQQLGHALALVNFCFDSGSSKATVITGASPTATVPLSQIAGIVKKHTTLRKFCRYFAKVIWNVRVSAAMPPAGYARANIKTEHQWAGFDFFDGLLNAAALNPQGGLTRDPSPAEITANETARSLSLFESNASGDNLASTSTHLTRGKISSSAPQIQYLPGPSD